MGFKSLLRRVAGAGAAIAALGAMLIAPASASTASTAPDEVSASSGWVAIRHASSRLCLTAATSGGVFLMDCQGLPAQKWYHFTGESNFDKFANGFDTACLGSNGQEVFTMPKIAVWRGFIMNHLIHHRGQLSVYLRLRDVPVPSIYGPTADEG